MSKKDDWLEIVGNVTSNSSKIPWMAELGSYLQDRKVSGDLIAYNLQISECLLTDGMEVQIVSDKEYPLFNDRILNKSLKIDVPSSLLEKEIDKHIANVVASFINKELQFAAKIYIYDLCTNLFKEPFNNTITLGVSYGIVPVSNDENDPEIEAINDYLILRKEYQLNSTEIDKLSKTQRVYLLNKYKKNNVKK